MFANLSDDEEVEEVKVEMIRLESDAEIDFSVKSHLTDATFVIEGRKIHAGKDFLSLHSPFFHAIFTANFAEKDQEEIELHDVNYEDFEEFLKALYFMDCEFQDNRIISLLELGNRYGSKMILDRVEDRLIASHVYTVAEKWLLADRYRLLRLHTKCFDALTIAYNDGFHSSRNSLEEVQASTEWSMISKATRDACTSFIQEVGVPVKRGRVNGGCTTMIECDTIKTSAELRENAIDSGVFASDWKRNHWHDEMNTPFHTLISYENYMDASLECGGLIWTLEGKCDEVDLVRTSSLCLVVNGDRPSDIDWKAEGIVEVSIWDPRLCKGPEMQFEFTVDSKNRKGLITGIKHDLFELFFDLDWNYTTPDVTVKIFLNKLSGVREIQTFDFIVPSMLGDATLVVGETRIYANEQYLSIISRVFRDMFKEDPDKSEYHLAGVDSPGELIQLLSVIYPCCKKISEETVKSLLELGKRFEIACVMDRAEKFLIEANTYISLVQLLQYADQHDLFQLEKWCMFALTKKNVDFDWIEKSEHYKDLSNTMKAKIERQKRKSAK